MMRAMIALIRREYLEHRGTFVIAPAILLALLFLAGAYIALSSHTQIGWGDELPSSLRFYETLYVGGAGAWWTYLLITLFFYFADAFSADSRNNAMLFWKSMPQSDLKILGSKLLAALTVFPAAIVLAMLLTGIIAYLPAFSAGSVLPGFAPPGPAESVSAWAQISVVAIVYYALGLLWYLPLLSWVGLLSTIFRRWSIPLAFLIPVVIGLFEIIVLRRFAAPTQGYVFSFLRDRTQFEFTGLDLETVWLTGAPIDAFTLISRMLAGADWVGLVGGLVATAVFLYAASEYRRRVLLT